MSIGTFCLVKNEQSWIAAYLLNLLPYVDEIVLFDGNSTDGTLDIIEEICRDNPLRDKIRLFRDKDPKNLREDYTRLFNECMWTLSTDYAFFCHPDMMVLNPGELLFVKEKKAIALSVSMRSFAGEPGGPLLEIKGRAEAWKSIYQLRPNLGAHYHGAYGAHNEDVYFSAITGKAHEMFVSPADYPYVVADSGLKVLHFSDVRPYERRLDRMVKCLKNQGWKPEVIEAKAKAHPRVTLKDGGKFAFIPAEYPDEFTVLRNRYRHLEKESALV